MARVYLARDLSLNRDVALRKLNPELSAALGQERFLREIEILRISITHTSCRCSTRERPMACSALSCPTSRRSRCGIGWLRRETRLPIADAIAIKRDGALDYAAQVHRHFFLQE
jgi:serine/threonine protein kinase